MNITAYRSPTVTPGHDLFELLDESLSVISPNSIVVITSKIISLCQNQVIPKQEVIDKQNLIQQESDYYLDGTYIHRYGICLTIKNQLLIPTAGIDESNGQDYYILYPENIPKTAADIWHYCRRKNSNQPVGVLITDSHTTPLRRGVMGIALGWCGFKPLYSYIGKPDLFGNPIRVTQVNILDALAASAVFVMGEGNEQTPLAIIEQAPRIHFEDHPPTQQDLDSVTINSKDDLYAPLLESVSWKKGSKFPSPVE